MSANTAPCILVIDDSDSIQQYVQATLLEEGYRVIAARDGAAALDQIALHRPDLILLDMYMPAVDGWSFLATYPKTPPPHVPIIAMSADVDVKKLPGVEGGLPKPFTIDGLLNQVRRFLPEVRSNDQAATG